MNDILPGETSRWQYLEDTLREVAHAYGYQEIRLPVLEKTELFKRSIGEVTDIVEKEMYTFDDRNGDSLTMRPEGTASCVRACMQHGLLHNQVQRLWYAGPMFRHERPQKGRYRQFHQIGIEAFGMAGPDIDAEVIGEHDHDVRAHPVTAGRRVRGAGRDRSGDERVEASKCGRLPLHIELLEA